MRAVGEMPEWPNGTDSKSVVPSPVPRVRIPISPPSFTEKPRFYGAFLFLSVLFIRRAKRLMSLRPLPLIGTAGDPGHICPSSRHCPQWCNGADFDTFSSHWEVPLPDCSDLRVGKSLHVFEIVLTCRCWLSGYCHVLHDAADVVRARLITCLAAIVAMVFFDRGFYCSSSDVNQWNVKIIGCILRSSGDVIECHVSRVAAEPNDYLAAGAWGSVEMNRVMTQGYGKEYAMADDTTVKKR